MEEKLYTKATIEKTDKGLVAVASTAVEDRHGEVVEVDGWDLKNFKKNPVLLWGHQHEIPAIGVARNIRKDGEGKKARLIFEPVFHEATEFARAIKAMVEDLGILNSFSVGFMPKDMDGNRYLNQELLEISLVNVPANPEARLLAVKGLEEKGFDNETIQALGITKEAHDDIRSELAVAQERINELEDQLSDVVKGLQSLNPRVDKRETAELRVSLAKVIGRATDKMLSGPPQPHVDRVALKVVKRASDRLSNDLKRDLQSGKNQRTS